MPRSKRLTQGGLIVNTIACWGSRNGTIKGALYVARISLGIIGVILAGIYLGGVGQDFLIEYGKVASDHMDHSAPVILFQEPSTPTNVDLAGMAQHDTITGDEIEMPPAEPTKPEQH
jgi:hypothetical protein